MCRAKSHPKGGYRCLPSKQFLQSLIAKSNRPESIDYIQGAVWFDSSNVSSIEEIKYNQEFLLNDQSIYEYLYNTEINSNGFLIYPKHELLVQEFSHLGSMISSVIDSRVDSIDNRMNNIHSLIHEIKLRQKGNNSNNNDQELETEIANHSLSLGYDLQYQTKKFLCEINSSGGKFEKDKFKGNKKLIEMFYQSAKNFPPQWTSMLTKKKLVKESDISSYTSNYKKFLQNVDGKFEIQKGADGIYAYSNVNHAIESYNTNPKYFQYQHEIAHELTHMFEQNSHLIKTSTGEFLYNRISNDKGQAHLLREKENSKVYADSFTNPLIGTIYQNDKKENEIFARGTESVLLGTNGSLIGLPSVHDFNSENIYIENKIADIEHRNLTLGLLAGIKLDQPI